MSSYGGTDAFDELGRAKKEGALRKKSPVLGLWKQRYVVLDGSTLTYYKSQAEYTSGSPGKAMNLSPASMTSFTPVENCFTIRQSDSLSMKVGAAKASSKIRRTSLASTKADAAPSAEEDAQWFLLAGDENELYEWVTAISAHIHVMHMQEFTYPKSLDEHMATGVSGTFFYEAPSAADSSEHKLPIGIRTIPELSGPRTGDAIYPGEICEVVHHFDLDGNAFLRLAGNRGWIFEKHPTSGEPLVALADNGRYEARQMKYTYPSADGAESIPIRFGPCLEARTTGEVVDAGEAELAVQGVWSPTVDNTGRTEYLKLAGTQGWIPNLGALKEVVAAPAVGTTPGGNKKAFRRTSINMARRSVDIRSGGAASRLVTSKDAMVSRRKSNLTLEEAVDIL